jgi:hypothetical protein
LFLAIYQFVFGLFASKINIYCQFRIFHQSFGAFRRLRFSMVHTLLRCYGLHFSTPDHEIYLHEQI